MKLTAIVLVLFCVLTCSCQYNDKPQKDNSNNYTITITQTPLSTLDKKEEPPVSLPKKTKEENTPPPSITEFEESKEIFEIENLIRLEDIDDTFVIDLKYATRDNFTGKVIYSENICVIHKDTAKKLISANKDLKKLGYRLKILDAYRPFSAQQILYDSASDKSYVANPQRGSVHNRGSAVDVTLVDNEGNELIMPSDFDEQTQRAHIDYNGGSKEATANRELLAEAMTENGFRRINIEWWHFEDLDGLNYPILDIPLEKFKK